MQYQVPQFIEIEDKIIGPLTLKQFLYLAGGGGVCLLFFTVLNLYIAAILAIPVVVLSLMLSFYQVNGRPFVVVLEHGFYYMLNTKLYLWKQREVNQKLQEQTGDKAKASAATVIPAHQVPTLGEQSKLKDLSSSLVTSAEKNTQKSDVTQGSATSEKPTHPSTLSFKI